MTFAELSRVFRKIEDTSSRIEITKLLAELFRKSDTDEIGLICYLLQGRVVPLYEALEFGVAEKFIIRAIAIAYKTSQEKIAAAAKIAGDLGIVAEKYHDQSSSHATSKISIQETYDQLYSIAQTGGVGSQEKKINILAELFASVDSLSARYIARIPLDKMRLGFSEMTILDALSWMLTGDKTARIKLESAYNVRPDIGFIATQIRKYGLKGLGNVHAKVGAPILASLCQRIPNADEMIHKMSEVAVEPKYDGVRCIGGYTGLITKNKGYVAAREVRVGDLVLTGLGRYKRITAVNRRLKKRGELVFRLQTILGDEIIISGIHPVLTLRGDSLRWIPAEQLQASDYVFFPSTKINQKPPASSLELCDEAGYQKNISFNTNFFRFLGFWIGDGFSNNSHQSERIGLTFNAKTEKHLASEYEDIIRNTLSIRRISHDIRHGGLNIYFRDPQLRRWLVKEFRFDTGTDHGKTIPEWMVGISRDQFLAFMRGWAESDGTERHSGGTRITTKENRLAAMAVILGFQFSYPLGIRRIKAKARKQDRSHTYFEIIIPGTDTFIKPYLTDYLVKIHSIDKRFLDSRTFLYDFQVEDDASFCTSLAVLHNCQIHYQKKKVSPEHPEIKAFSRNLENTTAMFPELTMIEKQVKAENVILDSEAVGLDLRTGRILPFQETSTRKRKHEIELFSKEIPIRFYVFDILYKDDQELLSKPLSERRKILEDTIRKGPILEISPQIVTKDPIRLVEYHDTQIKKGLEGAVVKKWHSPYEPGRRGYSWVKFKETEGKTGKLTDTIDAVVMGYYRGEGKRTGFGIGAFLVGIRTGEEFLTVTKIGTGVSDELWRELYKRFEKLKTTSVPKEYKNVHKGLIPDVWIFPKLVIEVAGDDLTKSPTHGAKYAIRFPRLVRIREDKSPSGATTLGELERMYKDQ